MLLGLNRTQRGSERHTSIERKSERACVSERERERERESKACETECELSAEQPRVARGFVLKLKIKAKHRGLIEVAAGGHQAISHLSGVHGYFRRKGGSIGCDCLRMG